MLNRLASFLEHSFFYELLKKKGVVQKLFFKTFLEKSLSQHRYKLNFYNHFLSIDKYEKAFELLNSYFHLENLLRVDLKDAQKPLYIDNFSDHTVTEQISNMTNVSIIVTTYNEVGLIRHSIKSLLAQTYRSIEVILVDDASSDKTVKVFEQTCQENNFSNYKIIRMKKNSGPFITRNIGIQYTRGKYITFHDADDWAHPQRMEEQVKALETNNKVASISQLVRVKPNGEIFSKHIYPLNRIAMVSLMIKREVLEELGFFYTDLLGADTEYFDRINYFYGSEKVENIKKVLTFAAHRPNSRTTSETTGTPEFGSNPLREKHWQMLEERLFEMVNGYKSFYITFDESKYEYEVVK